MTVWNRRVVTILAVLLILFLTLVLFRKPLILFALAYANQPDIDVHRAIEWQPGERTISAQDQTSSSPNIVFILVDDLGINDLSTFGGGVAGGQVQTPNIDRLAGEGVVFEQAYSGTATCAPSRAMLMTGRYPSRTGFEFTPTPDGMGRIIELFSNNDELGLPPVKRNAAVANHQPRFEEQGLPGSEITVAELLQQTGYRTAHIGKWHLGRSLESRPTAQGFDDSLLMASGLYLPVDDPNVVNARVPFDAIGEFLWARMRYAASFNDSDWFEPQGYLTDYWTNEAIRFLETPSSQPFFLYLAHWGVHTPLQATRADYEAVGPIEPHTLRVYAAMVRALDRSVGRLLEALERQGIADDTLIVFSSDNGGAGYLGLNDINAPYRGWKLTLFEGGLRVPLFMRWPNRIPPGQRVRTPVAHIDVMPTLAAAAAANLPTDRVIDGVSLLSAAAGEGTIDRPDDALYWSSGSYRAVRAGDWKLQVEGARGVKRLYNLADDPTEQQDLSSQLPEQVSSLEGLMAAHWANARLPLFRHTIEGPVGVDKTQAQPLEPGEEYVVWPN